jgi:hypothetical protein
MDKTSPDIFARWLATLALLVSMGTLFLEYTQSPLYPLPPPLLSYWQERTHKGELNDGRFDGNTVVHVKNASSTAVRDLRVVVWSPCDRQPIVRCLEKVVAEEAMPGTLVIRVPVIPANSSIEIEIAAKMEKPKGKNPWVSEPWLEAPEVRSVYSEYGTAPRVYEKCKQNFESTGYFGGVL